MRSARLAASALLLLALPAMARGDGSFALKDGDRVVFYGDSITDQRLYTTFAETYVVTRFPGAKISFVHSGWGGDRVTGGGGGPVDVRLVRDVEAYKPTVVTIMLGMNDASYAPFRDPIFKTYADGYEHIVAKLKADLPGVRLTLIKPSPYDDVTREPKFEGGYNDVLVRYGDFVRKLADRTGSAFADLNTSVVESTKRAFATDPEGAKKLNPDRIHPGPGGQLLMAEALLKSFNAPAVVSEVTIDPAAGKATPVNAKVLSVITDVEKAIVWDQTDDALPFPIDLKDPIVELAVRSSDFIDALDRQVVKAKGLDAENYVLEIDGVDIGTYTKAQLAEGVNLATLPTPMARQAAKVHALTLQHAALHQLRWRSIQVPYQDSKSPDLAKAIEGLDGLEAEVVAKQRQAAQPVSHHFRLKPKS